MEGKNIWKKFIPGGGNDESAAPEMDAVTEDAERDLRLLEECLNSPEDTDEKLALQVLERLLNLVNKNPDVKLKLERYLKEYEDRENEEDKTYDEEDEEKEIRFMKNGLIYEKIKEGLQKQRLGEIWYDKNDPRRKLGT